MGPNTTIAATAFGGSIAVVLGWISEAAGAPMPPQVAAAIATLFALAFGWVTPPGRDK
jgi:hypothetical protein